MTEETNSPQVTSSHYSWRNYDTLPRFCSYWHQIDETLKLAPRTVLEIGTGSGLVRERLRKSGVEVKTLDIADDLNPDIVGSVTDIPMPDKSVDVVLCCQVLEHLPYERFQRCLHELKRVSSQACVLSLPDARRYIKLSGTIPLFGEKSCLFSFPTNKPHMPPKNEHYWEIGRAGTSYTDVKTSIQSQFSVVREYRVKENPYHYFFVLK